MSVGDFEDPAEWDVIVVENEAIDDDTARQIAQQRSGRRRSLPSLDERDIMQAFSDDPDRDAEDAEGLSDDAFAPPAGPAVRRRMDPPPLPPAADELFGDVSTAPGPPAPAEEALAAPGSEPEGWSTDDVVRMDGPTAPRPRVSEEELEANLHDYPQGSDEPDDVDDGLGVDEGELPDEAEEEAPEAEAEVTEDEVAEDEDDQTAADQGDDVAAEEESPAPVQGLWAPLEPTVPVVRISAERAEADAPERTELLDDPADDFYAIDGEAPEAGSAAEDRGEGDEEQPTAAGSMWDPTPVAERDLLDDPGDAFYSLGAEAGAAAATAPAAPAAPTTTTVDLPPPDRGERLGANLWGAPPEPDARDEDADGDAAGDQDEDSGPGRRSSGHRRGGRRGGGRRRPRRGGRRGRGPRPLRGGRRRGLRGRGRVRLVLPARSG